MKILRCVPAEDETKVEYVNAKQIVRISQGNKGILFDFPSGTAREYTMVTLYRYNPYAEKLADQMTTFTNPRKLVCELAGWFEE